MTDVETCEEVNVFRDGRKVLTVENVSVFERIRIHDGREAFHIVGARDEQLIGVGLGYTFEVVLKK